MLLIPLLPVEMECNVVTSPMLPGGGGYRWRAGLKGVDVAWEGSPVPNRAEPFTEGCTDTFLLHFDSEI